MKFVDFDHEQRRIKRSNRPAEWPFWLMGAAISIMRLAIVGFVVWAAITAFENPVAMGHFFGQIVAGFRDGAAS